MAVRWRDDFDLSRRFSNLFPPLATQIAVGVVISALAIGSRLIIGIVFPNVVQFALVFPAIVVATLLAGTTSGIIVIVLCQTLVWYFLVPFPNSWQFATVDDLVSLVLATLSELILLWCVHSFRDAAYRTAELERQRALDLETSLRAVQEQMQLQRRMSDQEACLRATRQHLDAIWRASADGLTLCTAIRDDDGRVVDYQVIEVNESHRDLTGATREQMLGSPVTTIAPPIDPRWLESADRVLRTGVMEHFDVKSPATGRWLNIRVSPVSGDMFQQTFVDVSDRHEIEEQRRALMKEMSHRVLNNFMMMASFLRLQAGTAAPEAKRQLEIAGQRVQVLAKVHSILAYTENERDVDVAAYIQELCVQLGSIIDRPESIALRCKAAPLRIATDKVVSLGLIVSELVTNASKYAFPAPLTGEIWVCSASAGAEWVLTVQDNGKGLDEDGGPKSNGGLGTRLVKTFVRQLDGRMVTTNAGGLKHEIFFRP